MNSNSSWNHCYFVQICLLKKINFGDSPLLDGLTSHRYDWPPLIFCQGDFTLEDLKSNHIYLTQETETES